MNREGLPADELRVSGTRERQEGGSYLNFRFVSGSGLSCVISDPHDGVRRPRACVACPGANGVSVLTVFVHGDLTRSRLSLFRRYNAG